MTENEAKAREALKVWNQHNDWCAWSRKDDDTPEPPHPHRDEVYFAKSVLAAFAAEILERNP